MSDRLEAGRTLEALRRKNLEGKKAFIEELKLQRTPKSVSLLLEILCDESWYLRELAIAAIAESGEIAVPPLRNILDSGLWYTRAAAGRALGLLGDGASAGGILSLLDEPNRTVREAAVAAIQTLAERGGTDALCRSLHEASYERAAGRLSVLRRIDPDLSDRLEQGLDILRKTPSPETNAPRASDDDEGGGTAEPS